MQTKGLHKQHVKSGNESHYRNLFEYIKSGVAVYEAIEDGNDFIIKDFNRAGEIIDNVKRDDVIGKRVTEVFPVVNETGLLNMYREVWKTGKNKRNPLIHVKVGGHESWRENDIFKLPSGEVVAVYADITEKILAEQELQRSETRYKTLFNSIRDAILVADINRNIIDCNTAFTKLFGYTIEEIEGNPASYVFKNEDEYKHVGEMINDFFNTNCFLKTIHYKKKDGKVFPGETNVFYMKDSTRQVIGFIGVIRDISERVKTEKKIKQSELKFRNIFNNAVDAIFIHGMDGQFLEVNDVACKRLGYSRNKLLQMSPLDIDVPDYAQVAKNRILAVKEKGKMVFETAHVARDGMIIPVEISSRVIKYEGKTCILSIARDISARKQAEQKRNEYQKILNSTLDAIDSLIMVVDKDLRMVLSNWKNHEWVPLKQRKLQPYCYKVMKNYQSPCENCPPLKTFADGKTRWYLDQNPVDGSYKEISVIPIFDGDGHVEHVLENVKDVTERVKRQRILESKNEELEQFAYTVSHDLKSPLVTIKGFIGLLQQDILSGRQERIERYVNHIENASDKMIGLLDDLLQLSRAGRSVKTPEIINMELLAREVIEILDGTIQKTKANVVVNPGMPEVFGDKTRVRQVLQNLVENSLKYTEEQNKPLIELGSRDHENEKFIQFFVKDNGVGIEPEYHEKVFGVFDQLINDKGGSGIGLSLVKKIIELHHGNIWVESTGEKGSGTTFWFTLPAK